MVPIKGVEQLLWPFCSPVSYHDPLGLLVCSVSHRRLLFLATQPLEKGLEEHITVLNASSSEEVEEEFNHIRVTGTRLPLVLVHSGCYSKIPQTE